MLMLYWRFSWFTITFAPKVPSFKGKKKRLVRRRASAKTVMRVRFVLANVKNKPHRSDVPPYVTFPITTRQRLPY